MTRPFYFNKAGLPIRGPEPVLEWGRLHEDPANRFILDTWIRSRSKPQEPVRVATIWMGTDEEFRYPRLPPLIFETTLFDHARRPARGQQVRYTTLEDAWRGHWVVVEAVEALIPDYETRQDWRWHTGRMTDPPPFPEAG